MAKTDQDRSIRRMSKTELAERLEALQRPAGAEDRIDPREIEIQRVLHELEVYQIELEMQNRELRESRQAVEEAHDRYMNLYDFAPVGYVTLTSQGMIKEINLTAAGMLGVERRWLIGRALAPWIAGAELQHFREHLKKCVHGQERVTSALELMSKTRQSIFVELSSSMSTDPTSGEILIRTTLTDLTARREAEEERDRFFTLSTDLLCVMSRDGYFERINSSWEKVLGYSSKELLSRPYLDFVHPDDRDMTVYAFERILRGASLRPGFQNRFIKKDRSHVWLSWTGVTSGSAFYCVARDTTEDTLARKSIENQHAWLNNLVRSLPIPLVLSDAKSGAVLSMSSQALGLLDGLPQTKLDDASVEGFFYSDIHGNRLERCDWPRFRAVRGDFLDGEQLTWHTPYRKIHLLIWSRLIPAKFEHPEMVIVMLQDIGPLKLVEVSLLEAVEKLKLERGMREDFVSALTHDLRTPLTSVKLNVQLLGRQKYEPLRGTEIIANTLAGIDRIDRMIQDLLDANRIKAGETLAMNTTRFDLARLVNAAVEQLVKIHGPRIRVESSGRIVGHWSKPNLQRVVENLVNNAVKYGAPKRPITVSVSHSDEKNVLITVQNFGNPIPKEDLDSLFEQYRRARSAVTSGKKGWGVGLTLTRGIVRAHGGDITVVSDPENGTTFRIVLPIEPAV